MSGEDVRRPVVAAGAVVWQGDEVLLIRRGKAPRLGEWSIPGGRVEWGETIEDAVHREILEETGCRIEILGLCTVVDLIDEDRHTVLVDFTALLLEGEPQAGDDAMDARFVPFSEVEALGMWAATMDAIKLSREHLLALR